MLYLNRHEIKILPFSVKLLCYLGRDVNMVCSGKVKRTERPKESRSRQVGIVELLFLLPFADRNIHQIQRNAPMTPLDYKTSAQALNKTNSRKKE